ncbi:extracellular solute-binding protein [Diplocloster modestus]|uniref:Extracellular solute-binding protein n=1 Tax=Diplocloster modestus TaxID=2850322 RepID=A0ABS6KCV6_9FIRM|nr:extracellular solute-binding protein [Diplocloster modestus]MBU9728333.1 extracellular solute-binding protein [Diplocloster modestus]
MATLKDVAKRAGVSIATVSCCLSGAKNVRVETKLRVMEAIEELGYIPNSAARNLKLRSSKEIGVVLPDINDAFYAEILKGISSQSQQEGYIINVAFSYGSKKSESEKIEEFINKNVAGLLILSCQPENTVFFKGRIEKLNIPTVFMDRMPEGIHVNFASFDNYGTVYYFTRNLLQKDYKDIALITGAHHLSSQKACLRGYMDALNEAGRPYHKEWVRVTNMTKEDAFKAAMLVCQKKIPHAIISSSVTMTRGIWEALDIQGITPGKDIQVLTLGEESWSKSDRLPGVTHSSRTAFTMGTSVAGLLIGNIAKPYTLEKQNLSFTDDIVFTKLNLPARARRKKPGGISSSGRRSLRILHYEIPSTNSIKLVSRCFSNLYDVDIIYDSIGDIMDLFQRIVEDGPDLDPQYDIFVFDVPWKDYLADNHYLEDITEVVEGPDFNRNHILKENMDNCYYKNRCVAIPLSGGTQGMYYRQDLFEKASSMKAFKDKYKIPLRAPRTWTEFNGIAEFFTRSCNPYSPTEYGTSVSGKTDGELAPELLIRLWAEGGKMWNSKNRVCMDTPQNEKAFQVILETLNYVQRSPFDTSIEEIIEDFCSGKTAMLVTCTEYAGEIRSSIDTNVIGKVGYTMLPGKAPMTVGWNMGLSRYSRNKELAHEYFRWLCQKDTSYYMTILGGQSTLVYPYHSNEILELYPWMRVVQDSFRYSHSRSGPVKTVTSRVMCSSSPERILCNVMRNILNQGMSVKEALRVGQIEMEELFREYGYPM